MDACRGNRPRRRGVRAINNYVRIFGIIIIASPPPPWHFCICLIVGAKRMRIWSLFYCVHINLHRVRRAFRHSRWARTVNILTGGMEERSATIRVRAQGCGFRRGGFAWKRTKKTSIPEHVCKFAYVWICLADDVVLRNNRLAVTGVTAIRSRAKEKIPAG